MRRTQRGFTLMELMVVIVIVAILAAVAVPLYINYVRDAQRTEAKGAIGAVITAEQTHFRSMAPMPATTSPPVLERSSIATSRRPRRIGQSRWSEARRAMW
jgi:prepilin-type N-terminal cleavage/methylation domain-containing protein